MTRDVVDSNFRSTSSIPDYTACRLLLYALYPACLAAHLPACLPVRLPASLHVRCTVIRVKLSFSSISIKEDAAQSCLFMCT
jgi:hypothetical protein